MQSCSPHLPRYVLQLHACTQSGSYEVPILSYSYTLQFLQSGFLHILDFFSCLLWPFRVTNHLVHVGSCPVSPVGHTCMSFNPKSHTSNPTTHNLAPLHLSHAVSELLCSQYAIRQFPTSHALMHNQAVSNLNPLPIYNQAVLDLPCSQCSLAPGPTQILSRSRGEKSGEGPGSKLYHDRKWWTWLLHTVDSVL